jgi:hypothetical protein
MSRAFSVLSPVLGNASRGLTHVLLISALVGCVREPEIEILAGVDVCAECNMLIDQVNQAAGFVSGNDFITFDSPKCLLRYLESMPKGDRPQPAEIYFADYRDGFFHSAERATFLLTSHIPTVMNGQVVVFSDAEAAMDSREHPDEVVTDWIGYRTERGTPDRVLDVVFGPSGMEPETVEADKDDLVVLRFAGQGLAEDVQISIRGYPEAGAFVIPASGEAVEVRFLASKPGAGFPIGVSGSDPLGILKVTGAHTADEEVH